MIGRVHIPAPADEAIRGEKCAQRILRCLRDGMPIQPDAMLDELQDLALEYGRPFAPCPAMRSFLRTIQKSLEGRA
jgi:hypothetical protein